MPQTLQCPKCNQPVSVGDKSIGKRVKCPKCDKVFLAPGVTASANDDDDWLSLDSGPSAWEPESPAAGIDDDEIVDADVEVLDSNPEIMGDVLGGDDPSTSLPSIDGLPDQIPLAAPKSRSTVPPDSELPEPKKTTSASGPSSSDVFGGDVFGGADDFTSSAEALPGSSPVPKADLGEFDLPPLENAAPIPSVDAVEYEQEFRVKCNICGSLLYAKAKQEGKTIKCNDCHSNIVVPKPPKVKKKKTIDIDRAQTFSFEETPAKEKPADPYRKSAQDLLDAAEKQDDDAPPPDFDAPDVKEWAKGIFGIFLDPGVVIHWVGISLLGSLPAAFVLWTGSPLLMIGLFVGGLVLAATVASCGLAIMQAVANKHDVVSEWPTSDPLAWFDDLVVVLAAMGLAAMPVWLVTTFASGGPGLFSVAATMISIYMLFPFIILSMMDMNSIFVPFSPEVARSASRCQEAWGALYFSAGLLFFGLFLLFAMLYGASPSVIAVVGVFASVGVAFAYFGMIGRLAYTIGQPVNEPPKKRSVEEGVEKDGQKAPQE